MWAQRRDLRWETRHASVDVPVITETVTLRSVAPVSRVALALVVLLGCRVARGPATADAAREAPTRMLWQTTRSYASVEHHEPDGTLDVTFGALRVQVRDDVLRVAPDQIIADVRLAAPVARGWTFVGEDGSAFAARTFLGPLRRIGDFPGIEWLINPDRRMVEQGGRLGAVDRDGAAWMSDGGAFERVTALADEPVRQIAFVSERVGGAVSRTGALRCTSDGGAHWAAVPDAAPRVAELRTRGESLEVFDGSGPRLIGPDCRFLPGAAPTRARDLPEWTASAGVPSPLPVAWLLTTHDAAWIDALQGLPRPDGTLLAQGPTQCRDTSDNGTLFTLNAATGRVLSGVIGPCECTIVDAGHLVSDHCSLVAAARADRPHLTDPRGRRSMGDLFPRGIEHALPSDVNDLAFAPGACPTQADQPLAPPFDAVCAYASSLSDSLTRHLSRPFTRLVGVAGWRVLVATSDRELAVIDLDERVTEPSAVAPLLAVAADETISAGVGVGGVVTALVWQGRALQRAATGILGAPLVDVPLPVGVDRAVFADASHGFAWSSSFDIVARTRDAGRHWETLRPPIDGTIAPSMCSRQDSPHVPDSLRCTRARCVLDGCLVIVGWGPMASNPGRLFGAR